MAISSSFRSSSPRCEPTPFKNSIGVSSIEAEVLMEEVFRQKYKSGAIMLRLNQPACYVFYGDRQSICFKSSSITIRAR